VWVVTGPLYLKDMDPLPEADETHFVPSASGFVQDLLVAENVPVRFTVQQYGVHGFSWIA
jgi:hypothetical protein